MVSWKRLAEHYAWQAEFYRKEYQKKAVGKQV